MAITIEEFYQEISQEIYARADADGRYTEDSFFDVFSSYVVEAGDASSADRAHYEAPRGMRIDGYGGDPSSSDGVLSLFIVDYNQSSALSTLNASDMDALFKRAHNFVIKSFDSSFRDSLEETSPAFGLADLVAARWPVVKKVRLFLLSNRVLSSRVDGREAGDLNGIPFTYSVWDMGRLYRYATSGREREDMVINLMDEYGGPIPALTAHLTAASYEAYLAVVPGKQLADIYDRWGARLLEQNVRVFLQARGNVNKGIRNTIENDPEMFFAYNNGITATAEGVDTQYINGQLFLTCFRNLQVVNGGQTTASIHAASKKKDVDLSNVFVQMKLSIIEPDRTEKVVPKISEYANSQNRVNAADFFSNHPFHLRMADFSRRIYAPSPDGTFRETKWFYERARGQYQDARSKLTPAQEKKFDLEYPKRQVITKTDLAKFLNSWNLLPQYVSRGAQKNFAYFAYSIGKEWIKQPDVFNEMFYRSVIAKAIIFREVEKQPWYQGGYRANIVTYAIARLALDVERDGCCFDFDSVWRAQSISDRLKEALSISAAAVYTVILKPPPGANNITEWAKMEGCWVQVSELHMDWPNGLIEDLRLVEHKRDVIKSGVTEQRMLNDIEAQVAVVNAGAEFWQSVMEWGRLRNLLNTTQQGILDAATNIPAKLPSEKQCQSIIKILHMLHSEGCSLKLDT